MIRSVLLKLLLAAAVCVAIFVTCVSVAGYLAFSSPSFYSELVARQPRVDEAEAAEQHLEQLRSDFLQWHARSLAIQQNQAVENELGNPDGVDKGPVAEEDVHTIRLSDDDVNALLASDESGFNSGEVRDPRIRFDQGQVLLAFKLATPAGEVVLSAGFVPRLAVDDEARFQVAQVSIGRLSLPISTLSHWVPKRELRLHGELYLDATGPLPELVLRTGKGGGETASPTSIECAQGEIVVRLTAPALPQE